MDDLVTWLRAQLDDDERVARAAADYGAEWRTSDGAIYPSDDSMHPGAMITGTYGGLEDRYAEHIARWDPARVLAGVDAKRRILAAHFPVDPCDAHDAMSETIACDTLRLLALPLADRPGYLEEWFHPFPGGIPASVPPCVPRRWADQ